VAPFKNRRARLILAGVVVVLGIGALRVVLWRPRAVVGEAPRDGYTRVAGAVHVHTTLSDGGGTPEEVAQAARRAGLGFVILTDHNNLDAKPSEGYHDGVLVLVGTEISTTAGHLLGLGIADPVFRFSGDERDALEDVHALGGLAFAAHPHSARADFRWTAWDLPGPWGLELLNGDSQWRAAGWWRLGRTATLYGLNPRYALLGSLTSPSETLPRWDQLSRERDVTGIVGADAHNRLPLGKRFAPRFPSYESVFALARNHLLLDRPLSGRADEDGRTVLDALRRGRAYVGLDALAPAEGFSFVAEAEGRRWTMGETAPPLSGLRMKAGGRLPAGTRLSLLRGGQVVAQAEGVLDRVAEGPGVYRVEARVPGWDLPWVLSNPIYVFGPEAAAARASRGAWPEPEKAASPSVILDDFEGGSHFVTGADPTSSVSRDLLAPGAGLDGKGAARLEWHLAAPSPTQPHTFCALVDWTKRDLRGRTGLSFSIRADGVYRIWVQVRDENPASADEGTEWWFASVRTSTEWQQVALPFARLRSINPRTDGRLDLDKVRALVFVLDRGAVKTGTSGVIWLDHLGLY
jgi:hypothetical protein